MEELPRGGRVDGARVVPSHDEPAKEERERERPDLNRPSALRNIPSYEFQGILPRVQPVTLSFTTYVGNGVPDTMGAIGPRQFVLFINNRIKTFDKRTGQADGVIDLPLSTFFRPVGTGPYDPNARFDRRANKWILGAVSAIGASNGSNRLMFAVSDSGVLSSTTRWTFFEFQYDLAEPAGNTGCSADFPSWGQDAIALYVTVSPFRCPGERGGGTIFVIKKESLFGDGPIAVSTVRNIPSDVGYPVDDLDSGGGTAYFLRPRTLCRLVDTGGSPRLLPCVTIQGTELSSYFTSAIRHRGNNEESGSTIVNVPNENVSGRIAEPISQGRTAMIRRGHLWMAMTLSVDNTGQSYFADELTRVSRLGIVWMDLVDIDSDRPRVAQSGRVFAPSANNDVHQRNYWMPAIAVSGQGHMMIGASAAGSNEYINAVAVGRLGGDAPGMLRDPAVYTDASAAYNASERFGTTGLRRWGDYSHTLVDPCDDMTMWTVQQYTAETDKWGIAVARMSAPPPVTATTATPNEVPTGQDNVEVQLKGTATNGAGFFDPGAGFDCRLRVEIPGATVNAVRVVDPTTLSISLSTRGTSPGPLSITVTNPDGQSAIAENLVRVK
jgi:hypothetical protein